MAKRDYDYLFKLVLIGDSGVGKSCLLLRFAVSHRFGGERVDMLTRMNWLAGCPPLSQRRASGEDY